MKIMRYMCVVVAMACIAASCSTPKVAYFQDLEQNDVYAVGTSSIRFRPEDKLSIVVNAANQQVSAMFNLPYITRYIGSDANVAGGQTGLAGYTIDQNGNIDFPVLGSVHIAGMTRSEVASYIKERLSSEGLATDPVVTVDYMNLQVSVFGEVTRPGRYPITRDSFTLLDALSAAGDLTIYGKRDNVIVMRDEGGVQKRYVVDMSSAQAVMTSPAYYMQQNDVIYVEPNDVRARQSTVNGNNVRSTSFWISLTSLASTIALYFIR